MADDPTDQLAHLREEVARLAAAQAATATRLAHAERALTRYRARRGTRRGERWLASLLIAALIALVPLGLVAANFQDLNPGSPHNNDINAIANAGITLGCEANVRYCPNDTVTREQMASFLARTAGLGNNPPVANALTAVTAQTAQGVVDGAITPPKVSADGSANGQVLMSDGTSVSWQDPPSTPGPQGPTGATGPQGPPGVSLNTLDIALLRWYVARGGSGDYPSFPTGTHPSALAFDGSHMWVANYDGSGVSKLRVGDGANIGNFAVGGNPVALAYDGSTIWVASQGLTSVVRLRASDGQNIGTAPALANPKAMVFDGTNIWVAANTGANGMVSKIRASDGSNLGNFEAGGSPTAIAFDGTNIWIANASGSGTVTRLRASDGFNLGSITVGVNPGGLAFDGSNVWVSVSGNNTVVKLRASDGANLGSFAVGTTPGAIAVDGQNIWVANTGNSTVTKLRASDGSSLGIFPVGTDPRALAFDGSNIWVANFGGNSVTKR